MCPSAADPHSPHCSGLPSQAFEYIRYNKGLESEKSYPYKAHDETCHFQPSEVAANVTDVVNITAVSSTVLNLLALLANSHRAMRTSSTRLSARWAL